MSLDSTDRKVRMIVYLEAARAYGFIRDFDRVEVLVCEGCGGDGCERCAFTGDPS